VRGTPKAKVPCDPRIGSARPRLSLRVMLGGGILFLALSFAFAPITKAEIPAAVAQPTENSGLDELLAYAVTSNPGLDSAFQRWRAALERIPQAGALPDPRFSYSYFFREVETRVGPQRQKFGLSQALPWFGKLDLKEDAAARAAEAEGFRYEAAIRAVLLEVKSAYFELAYLSRAVDVIDENLSILIKLENVVRARYRTGQATHSDLIRAQVERGKLEDRKTSLEDLRNPLEARLNAALGRSSEAVLPRSSNISASPAQLDEGELLQNLLTANPELLALDREMDRQRVSLELARKQSRPDFNIGFEFMETGGALMPDVEDSGKDPFAIMFSINLPLWQGKYRAAQREASSRGLAADGARRDLANRLSARLKKALYEYRNAMRKIALYRDNLIPQGNQALEVTEQAFKAGNIGFTGLVDAQRVLLEFQLSYERALSDRALSLANIEMLAAAPRERTE